jgi:peroxiredoxin
VVLGINEQETQEQVKPFAQELGIRLPILYDLDGHVAQSYYVRSFPTTFFVDSEGILRAQYLGQMDEVTLVNYLDTIGIKP